MLMLHFRQVRCCQHDGVVEWIHWSVLYLLGCRRPSISFSLGAPIVSKSKGQLLHLSDLDFLLLQKVHIMPHFPANSPEDLKSAQLFPGYFIDFKFIMVKLTAFLCGAISAVHQPTGSIFATTDDNVFLVLMMRLDLTTASTNGCDGRR